MPPTVGKEAISVAFVRLSVCLSVAHIANNSRTQRPSVPKFGRKVPHLLGFDATRIPVSRSKLQRSRSPDQLMLTHIVRHIFRMARPTNFKLGIRMEDDDLHQPQASWPPRSKVKLARSRNQFEPSWPNCVIRGRLGHTVSTESGCHTSCWLCVAKPALLVRLRLLAKTI